MSINTPAQYGNVLTDPQVLAYQRGSGNFNSPPLYEQTTNRGNSWNNAANEYVNSKNKPKIAHLSAAPFDTYIAQLDAMNKQPHSVGNTGFHPQKQGSWSTPNIDGVDNRYNEFAQKATQLTPNTLMSFFFSPENVDYLQTRIIEEVKRIQKVEISRQSDDELLIIMNNHYQRALSGWLPHSDGSGQITNDSEVGVYLRGENKACSLTERLSRLNESVLQECTSQIISSVNMYHHYYMTASSLPLPLSRPTYTSMKGSRVLSEQVGLDDNGHAATLAIDSFNQRNNIF